MSIKAHIEQIRLKKQKTEARKAAHDRFVEKFIRSAAKNAVALATGLSLSTNADAKAIERYIQDTPDNRTENVKTNETLVCPIFNRVYEINYENCNRKYDVEMFVGHKNKAAYHSDYDHIVCETFSLSDREAYKIGNDGADDFDIALKCFKLSLEKNKYTGEMPHTLEDVKKILEGGLSDLKEKQREKIINSARVWGITDALQIKSITDKANNDNTSEHTVNHEHIHAKNAPILKKALLPSSLVSPQHLLLLNMADELEAQLNGKTSAQEVVNAVNNIKKTNTTNYTMNWMESVEAHKTEINTYYLQNLDISDDGKIVDNFSQQNYEKLLKEMIPDDNLRTLIKAGLKELQKLKPQDREQGFYPDYTAYNYLRANHNNFLRGLSVETVKFEKANPYTDDYAKKMAETRRNNIVSEYGNEHYKNIEDVSQNYTTEKGKIKKTNESTASTNRAIYVAGFDYGTL